MAGPWEQYAAPAETTEAGPWTQYQAPAERGVVDQLLGQTGPRYQTWPEKLIRGVGGAILSGATLPGDVLKEATQPAPPAISDSDVSTLTPGRVLDAAALGAPANPAVRVGDRAFPGIGMNLRPDKAAIPTAEQLLKTGGAQIGRAGEMGVEFTPQAVQGLGRQIESELSNRGVSDEFAKETYGLVRRISSPPEGAVSSSFDNIKTFRQALQQAASSPDARERRAAAIAIEQVDKWLSAPNAESLLAGTASSEGAEQAARLYREGRGNYAAGKRSEDITGRAEKADLRAAAANSGRNVDNATRQRFVDVLTSDKAGRGYTQEELDAVERLVRGTGGMNAARYIGNLFGGGGGLGQLVTGGLGGASGAAVGGPVGAGLGAAAGAAVPPTIGALAKSLSNTLTRRQVEALDELIRMRSPMFAQQPLAPGRLLGPSATMRGGLLGLDYQR